MMIHFFHYCKEDTRKHMLTKEFYDGQWQKHWQELQLRRSDAAAAAAPPADMSDLDEAGAALKPPWLLDVFQLIRFYAPKTSSAKDASLTSPLALLYWGEPEDVIAHRDNYVRLKSKVFAAVRADLTGAGPVQPAPAAPPAAGASGDVSAAVAASKAARKRGSKQPAVGATAATGSKRRSVTRSPAMAGGKRPKLTSEATPPTAIAAAAPAPAASPPAMTKPARAKLSRCRKKALSSSEEEDQDEDEGNEEEEDDGSDTGSDAAMSTEESDDNEPLLTFAHRRRASAAADEGVIERIDRQQLEGGQMWFLVKWVGLPLDASDDSKDWFTEDLLPADTLAAFLAGQRYSRVAGRRRL
jgi:hypothetical protein